MTVKPVPMRAALHAAPLDARRGIVRAHATVLSMLALRAWEPVELTGRRKTGALLALADVDANPGLLFMDELVLANVGVRPGDQVYVGPAAVAPATSIVLGGLPHANVDPAALRMALLGKIVTVGDGVSLLPQDFVREAPVDTVVPALAAALGDDWQHYVLHVASVLPNGWLVRVGMQTTIVAGAVSTATSSTPVTDTPREPVTREDLPALEEQAETLREWLDLGFHRADLLKRLGTKPELGILVTGPAGSGKGPLVEAVAHDVGATLHRLWAPALARIDPNVAHAKLKETITKAASSAPAVILLEDVEAVAPREQPGPLLSVVQEQIEIAVKDARIAVICTTSRPEEVSHDIRRPGLLDQELVIPLPQRPQRQRILQTFSRSMPLATDVLFDALAERTPGFVAADLKALCREASLRAAARLKRVPDVAACVTFADFLAALEVVSPSAVEQSSLEVADVTMADVGDMEETKRHLMEMVVWPLAYPETFERLGIEPGRGVLLHGPPGCGKTFLVKALANEANANFFPVRGAELLSKWVGESERGVRELFRRARGSAPALIFFDEIDALAPVRGSSEDGAPMDRVVAQLLTELDGVEERRDVFIVAATNRPELVDPALLRPGRLERHVHVPPPDATGRGAILRAVTRKMPLAPDVDLDALGTSCEGYSAADLAALSREAAMTAMRESMAAPVVTAVHFGTARGVVRPSIRA